MPRESWRIEPTITLQYLEHAPTALVAATADQRILFANHRALALFGYEAEQVANQPMEHLIAPSARERWTSLWQEYRATHAPIEDLELTGLHRDGGEIALRFTLGHIHLEHSAEASAGDAQTILMSIRPERSATGRPVTESAVPERSVRDRRIQELEQRLEQRDRELADAYKELDSFNFSVSHDLRAPLRAIAGFSRMLLEDYGERVDAEGKRYIDVIVKNVNKMSQLIDDLLAFSQLGRKQLLKTSVDMQRLVEEIVAEHREAEPERAIEVRVGELPPAFGDPAMLRQAVFNLVSNALKYSRGSNPSVVEVDGTASDQETTYRVRDNGVGFDMAYADKLFGVFQRLHAASEFEGTGVGLALVQRVVQRHGGRVRAEGKVGQGATFEFSLPRSDAHRAEVAGAQRQRANDR